MIDLVPTQAHYYWTLDLFGDLEAHREGQGFGKSVWKSNEISSYAIGPNSVSFDRPEEWDEGPTVRLELGSDGFYRQISDGLNHEGVRADTDSHVFMTGMWEEDRFAKGVFIAVFPRKSSS